MGWGRMEGVLRQDFIEKGALELNLEGRIGVYRVERIATEYSKQRSCLSEVL